MNYEGPERRAYHGWHLKREVNVGHLLTTITLAIGLISWGMRMDTRVTVIETRQAQQEADLTAGRAQVTARLDRIEDKLDRLIERGFK